MAYITITFLCVCAHKHSHAHTQTHPYLLDTAYVKCDGYLLSVKLWVIMQCVEFDISTDFPEERTVT
jgi:hypothetical protein